MAEPWIKMMVGMFEGMSFKRIKRAKIGGEKFRDKLTAVWFELMALAGRCNQDGALIEQSGTVLSELDDIATQIDREEEELQLCMAFYLKEGMVTHSDGVYSISNWAEYQNIDGLAKIREQNRLRKQKQRANQKLLTEGESRDGHGTVTQCHALEEDREEDKDKEKENSFYHSAKNNFSENEFSTGFSTELSTAEDKKRKLLGGELGKGVVFLSEEQMDDLLEKLSIEEFDHYVSVVADCILKGKPYKKKTHYQAILDMAHADRKIM
jgi:predicted phage replisome organizer